MTQQHANPEDFDLYALDALDGEEKRAFEEHLRACPACRQELAAARLRTSLLGLAATPVAPPLTVKSALMERVHAEASMSSTRPDPSQPHVESRVESRVQPHRKRWGLRFSLIFAAATVVLAFCTWWLAKDDRQQRRDLQQLQAQLQTTQEQAARDASSLRAYSDVVAAPDTVSVTLQQQPGGPPGQAHVLYNARMGLAVYSGQISPVPAGKSYQLWLVPASGAPVNAGLVAANQQNGAVVVHLEQGLSAKAFAVTLEPEGGSAQPTGQKVLIGAVNG